MIASSARMILLSIALAWATPLAAQTTPPGENLIRRSATTSAASAQSKPSLVGDGVRVIGSLAAVLGLIVLMYWGTRRMLPQSALGGLSGVVKVLARTHLSPKQKILLIQVGRRVLVVADGGSGQLNTLCQIDDPDEAAALIGQVHGETIETGGRSFASLFGQAKERMRGSSASAPAAEEVDELASAREQLDGLMQQVRGITRQIDRS